MDEKTAVAALGALAQEARLRVFRLVTVDRDGRNLHYRPALAQMNALLGYLSDHCCQGQACAPVRGRRRTTC